MFFFFNQLFMNRMDYVMLFISLQSLPVEILYYYKIYRYCA